MFAIAPSRHLHSSISAQPIPCTTPPWICPRASVSFRTFPISCTATKSITRTSSVRRSTSTSATYVAHANVPYACPLYVFSSHTTSGGFSYALFPTTRSAPFEKKGTGELEGQEIVEITYEGYGPGGMAVMVEAMTDNRNRTVAEVRHLFSKHGGNLGENGCVAYMFDRVGQIVIGSEEGESPGEEEVFEVAAEAGAEDVRGEDGAVLIVTPVEALEDVRAACESAGMPIQSAELVLEPQNTVELDGSHAASAFKLLDALEDHDDVQRVSANFEIDEAQMAELLG